MFNKILKGAAICSVLSLSLIWGWKSVQASTNDVKTDNTDNNFTVNGEVLTEDEYWTKIEALGVEVTDSAQRDKFIPEDEACAGMNAEEFYNYISDLAAEPNEIYVLGLTEVSEEEFNKALNEDIGDYSTTEEDKFDYETVSSKSKVVASKSVGRCKILLSINYDVETESNKRYISSATADLKEKNIPNNFEWSADSLNCTISDNQKRATTIAKGDLYKIVPRKGEDIRVRYRVTLSGSVSAQYEWNIQLKLKVCRFMKDAGLRYKNKNEFVSDRRKNMLKNIIKVLAGVSVL